MPGTTLFYTSDALCLPIRAIVFIRSNEKTPITAVKEQSDQPIARHFADAHPEKKRQKSDTEHTGSRRKQNAQSGYGRYDENTRPPAIVPALYLIPSFSADPGETIANGALPPLTSVIGSHFDSDSNGAECQNGYPGFRVY